MNFKQFYVGTTNIFPAVNSTAGGQLLTEWNLRCRESVATDPEVKYFIGPSYTKGIDDFAVSLHADESGQSIEIASGTCMLNGHFVQSLAPIIIDIADANLAIATQHSGDSKLVGMLVVGLRAMYSTESTMAGTLQVGDDDTYEGVQVVILPESEFKLPSDADAKNDPEKVTAHLKLATFSYIGNKVGSIENNADKITMLDFSRVRGSGAFDPNRYVTKDGLENGKFYTFAGKSEDPSSSDSGSTWCDTSDAMISWKQATFTAALEHEVALVAPRMTVPGQPSSGNCVVGLPAADFGTDTPGILGKSAMDHITKGLSTVSELSNVRLLGTQISVVNVLSARDSLPKIDEAIAKWKEDNSTTEDPSGPYVLVLQDNTLANSKGTATRSPSSAYFIIKEVVAVADDGSEATDATNLRYTDPVLLTGEVALATDSTVGGFLNLPESAVDVLDKGYVCLDPTGHLKLVDYALLRSGTLAYQLAADYTVPAGLNAAGIQSALDEYVNNRVAFRDMLQVPVGSDPYVIHVYLNFSASEEQQVVYVRGIDSRFSTSVHLHIRGHVNNTTHINILDCEKIRISLEGQASPQIGIHRSNVYYDPSVLNAATDVDGLSLWYEKQIDGDADLSVDGLTVYNSSNIGQSADTLEFWDSETAQNDNHYKVSLRSITFDCNGKVVGCEIFLADDTTANITTDGRSIINSGFTLPSSDTLAFPETKLTKPLHISGQLMSTYAYDQDAAGNSSAILIESKVSIVSEHYNEEARSLTTDGRITIIQDTSKVTCNPQATENMFDDNGKSLTMYTGKYHVLKGYTI